MAAHSSSGQLGLGPMSLQSLKHADLSSLNSAQQAVILAEVIVTAAGRLGMQKKELAALFELSPPDFTVAFINHDDKRNRLMKVPLPLALARQMALQLCEATGLLIGGPDAERAAMSEVLRAMSDFIRVAQR